MSRFNAILAFAAFMASAFLSVPYASAQATRSWVSGVGDDANPCSRTAPCKTFAGAISKTAAGGEINCLDPAGYGPVTITKSMTIDCTGTLGSVLSSSTTGVIVNGADIDVTLRAISLNGAPPASPGVNGIRYLQGASLTVENCLIQNFALNAGGAGNGILVNPSGGNLRLAVNGTRIFRNGAPNVGHGILFLPSGSARIRALITNSSIDNNDLGINALNDGTGAIDLVIAYSSISNNARHGIVASGVTTVDIKDSVLSENDTGVQAVSPAVARIGSSLIARNSNGVTGTILSFGNNQLIGNNLNGNPTIIPPG
jgi:hypothetical protein